MCALIVLLTCAPLLLLLGGIKRVPLGAVGVVISMGRRTGAVRQEGTTWLLPLVTELVVFYRRERQVDVPEAQYYTSDRVRISFKTTLRVAVTDPVALFEQGPGTYEPFRQDAQSGEGGGEEANLSLRKLVQNSIRETVESMRIDEVLFGGSSEPQQALRERIRRGLGRTAQRWGLGVVEVWLTEVDADDKQLKQAVQAEVREKMEGKGHLASWEAQVQKGALFNDVALQMVEKARRELGRDLPIEEARNFLLAFYQNEGALEVAMRSAGGQNDFMNLFYLQHLGLPLPNHIPLGMSFPTRPTAALQAAAVPAGGPEGSFILGREGDILVEGDGVSRHHARLVIASGQMTLTDLGSTNGTFVSGRRLPPQMTTPVGSRDTVGLGKTVIVTTDQLVAATGSRNLRSGVRTQEG
jgi:regulator of protease activity HflC (stomatin/prohibitin superfamily)